MEVFRDHAPYHERRLEQQMLDALLRIEEILARAFPEVKATEAEEAHELLDNRLGGIVNVRREGAKPEPSKGKRR